MALNAICNEKEAITEHAEITFRAKVCLNPLKPLHQYAYSPYCSLYISYAADKENLFNDREAPQMVIISYFLKAFKFDLRVLRDMDSSLKIFKLAAC